VDAATGEPRWLRELDDLLPGGDGTKLYRGLDGQYVPVLEDLVEGLLVFVPYISFTCTQLRDSCQCEMVGCEEVGIAALSRKDASVRWTTPIAAVGGMRRVIVVPRAASDDLVIVGIVDPFSNDLGSLRTVALNNSDGNQRWLASRFLTGPSLAQVVRTVGALAGPTAGLLALRLAQVLTDSHRQGVVHSDLKPSDVLLVPTGPAWWISA
jgi:hypothetical protein